MLRHNFLHHPEDDPMEDKYLWYPTGFYQKAMERQIAEAIKIKEAVERAEDDPNFILMNGKMEYNRCVLPGITRTPTQEDKKEDERVRGIITECKRQFMRRKRQKPDAEETEALEETALDPDLEQVPDGQALGSPPPPPQWRGGVR